MFLTQFRSNDWQKNNDNNDCEEVRHSGNTMVKKGDGGNTNLKGDS